MKKLLLKNILHTGLSSVVIGLFGFFLIPYSISKVGVAEYGLVIILYIFGLGGYLSLFEMGFQASIAKHIAEYSSKKNSRRVSGILVTMLLFFFLIGISLMLIGFGFKHLIVHTVLSIPSTYRDSFSTTLGFILISYLFQFPSIVYAGIFQGLQRFDILKGVEVFSSFSHLLMVVVFLTAGYGYVSIVISLILSKLLLFILYFLFSLKLLPHGTYRLAHLSKEILGETWSMARYIFTAKLSSLIYYNTPPLLISITMGPAVMAYYEVLMKLPRFLKRGLGLVNSAVMPTASVLDASENYEKLNKLFIKGLTYQLFFSVPIIIGAIYFSEQFLVVWVGNEFSHLATLLQIALIGNVIIPLTSYGGSLLVGMNRRLKDTTLLSIVNTITGILIYTNFAGEYGLNAVVIGLLLGNILTLPAYLMIYRTEFKIKMLLILKPTATVLYLSLIPMISILLVELAIEEFNLSILLLKGGLWCTVYWATLYFIAMSTEDRKNIKQLLFAHGKV